MSDNLIENFLTSTEDRELSKNLKNSQPYNSNNNSNATDAENHMKDNAQERCAEDGDGTKDASNDASMPSTLTSVHSRGGSFHKSLPLSIYQPE